MGTITRFRPNVDQLNMALMLISCLIALNLPFHLFLFSYAVLGPLHYLTQLSWLHDRDYFVGKRRDSLVLMALCTIGFVLSLVNEAVGVFGTPEWFARQNLQAHSQLTAITAGFVAFGMALIYSLRVSAFGQIAGLIMLCLLGSLAAYSDAAYTYYLLFAVFLPTLIHVYVFTAFFLIFGALKSRSASGLCAVGVYAICTVLLFLVSVNAGGPLSGALKERYDVSFAFLSREVLGLLHARPVNDMEIYTGSTGVLAARFIAFAYTYHYLNWFSKTSIIRWHEIPRRRLTSIVVAWVASIALFAVSFKIGLLFVGFLGLLHIFMEFPLDWIVFRGIFREIKSIAAHGWRKVAA